MYGKEINQLEEGMAQLGETKNYRLETHWLGVNKTEWANTLGENVSLLCPVSAHR